MAHSTHSLEMLKVWNNPQPSARPTDVKTMIERDLSPPFPPNEPGPFREPEWVCVPDSPCGPKLDVRYASPNNFLGQVFYPAAQVFLQKPAASALMRANQRLQALGFGLLIFDGYRPWSVTKLFWDSVEGEQRLFLADPAEGSRHNRGCTVDLSLFQLGSGEEVQMPSEYDEMTEKAYPDYAGGTAEQRRLRDFLRQAMEAEGFTVHPREWWHFDHQDWQAYALFDLSFEQIQAVCVSEISAWEIP